MGTQSYTPILPQVPNDAIRLDLIRRQVSLLCGARDKLEADIKEHASIYTSMHKMDADLEYIESLFGLSK